MSTPRALRQSFGLRFGSAAFLAFWCLLAAFPIFWILIMSFKLPVDALASNPLDVIFGPSTRIEGGGISLLDIVVFVGLFWLAYRIAAQHLSALVPTLSFGGPAPLGWLLAVVVFAIGVLVTLLFVLPILSSIYNFVPLLGAPIIGATTEHYLAVWVDNEFYRNFVNSLMVTAGVVTISLTVGTLAGYGLARSGSNLAFWLLILALIFRALPHSVLVTGYLPVFINSAELLEPIFGESAPTLYGKPLAVILVLVSINQPFTIWMLRSFFQNIPQELD
ncbi:MAG: carbohydrate ABC transporter permease, partial [Pseudomonadota bacterium]